ncbi:hypothetical protein [Paludibacterium denitrificans]|uniref:hypothetical protein n=1 Tax=Paludibacterium denitrificans TaxID=2675226 RepID=UPI001E56A42C|nr:hypothetical protein [Paludibacterium denitrificans]
MTDGALLNVNNQVEGAILKFSGEVEAGHLAVIGAYYDFRNDLHQGAGRLVITNINGETGKRGFGRCCTRASCSNTASWMPHTSVP